jgi:hypothetical protein
MIKLGLADAGYLVDTVMEWEERNGRKFKKDARENLLISLEIGIEEEKLFKLFDTYAIPDGIKMPWGAYVTP